MAKKSFVNIPVKGIMTDLDKSRIPQDRCTVSENVRFFDDDSGDFVARPALGNKRSWILSPGFAYKGHIEKGDISFIFSENEAGEYEVGSYPSPNQLIGFDEVGNSDINNELTGFKDEYQPLCTFEGNKRLRTSLFDFGDKDCQGVVKIIYDGTYGIYYTDRKNPLGLINSGFDTDGIITEDHDITDDFFVSNINLIQGSANRINNASAEIISGGELDYATYFFYLRYSTKNLDVSNIVSQIGPVIITRGVSGDENTFAGDNTFLSEEKSNKSVILNIINSDSAYEYVEVLFTKFTTDSEGELFHENKLIDKKFTTETSMSIKITGVEQLITVIPEEIINDYPVEDKANYIHEFDNMLWGSDWINQSKHSSIVKKFAGRAFPSYTVKAPSYEDYKYSSSDEKEVSYFAEEIYPFTLKAIMINGTVTYPYPVLGGDFYNGTLGVTYNVLGLVRFPKLELDVNYTRYNDYRMLGISFDLLTSWTMLTPSEKEWMNKNISGFVIMQGDRIVNRVYSGIGLEVVGSKLLESSDAMIWHNNNVSMPFFSKSSNKYPHEYLIPKQITRNQYKDDGQLTEYGVWFGESSFSRNDYEKKLIAIYSPEIMFSKFNSNHNIKYCKRLVIEHDTDAFDNDRIIRKDYANPNDVKRDVIPNDGFGYLGFEVDDDEYVGNTINNTPANPSPKFRCVNQAFDSVTEPNESTDGVTKNYSLFYGFRNTNNEPVINFSHSNRNLFTPKYLVLKGDTFYEGLYVLYKKNPETIIVKDAGDPKNIIYYDKSDFIKIDEISEDHVMYRGDAFYGVVNFKQMSWDPSSTKIWDFNNQTHVEVGVDVAWTGESKIRYAHGMLTSFRGFYDFNIGARGYDDTKSFYPVSAQNISSINYLYYGPRSTYYTINGTRGTGTTLESYLYNKAYHQLNSIRGTYGFDNVSVYDEKIIRADTRIRFSSVSIPGEIRDSWRIFTVNAYQDFDKSRGRIIGLASAFGKLLSIQENAINQHYVNEKQIKIPSTSGEIVLGRGDMLSDKVNVLAEYGAQSDKSFVLVYEKIFGYDNQRNIAWIIGVDRGDYRTSIKSADITEGGLVVNLFKKNIHNTDVLVSANKGTKTIWFSSFENQKTIIFDYLRSTISTVKTYGVKAAISILDDFYVTKDDNVFYKENNANMLLNYFGKDHDFRLGVVVNGLSESENLSSLDKIFESVSIISDKLPLTAIHFNTETQLSMLVPFYSKEAFWKNPVRDGSKWIVPVPLQENDESYLLQGTEMNGTWMEIIITKEAADNFYVKSLETQFKLNL